ncbi:MAG: hypothetical protein JSW54_02125, partial [Fidelibacterota bacterium]
LLGETQWEGEDQSEEIPSFRIGTRFGTNLPEVIHQLKEEMREMQRSIKELQGVGSQKDSKDQTTSV